MRDKKIIILAAMQPPSRKPPLYDIMRIMELLTGINDHGRRLDRILRKTLPSCPLPLIHKLLRKGLILVNGKPAQAQTRVAKGSRISIPRLTARKIAKKSLPNTAAQNMPSRRAESPIPVYNTQKPAKNTGLSVRFFHPPEILWQGSGLIAFNKPAGLQVHGQASLDKMVQAYFVNKLPHSLSFKPGPLHRLDKPSSGIVIFSLSLEGANLFSSLMNEHKIKKTYLAIVEGSVKHKYFWTNYIIRDKEKKKSFIAENEGTDKKGKIAITMAAPVSEAVIGGKPYTLIEAEIETGRTHQIRAQSGYHGYPLAGDKKYGGHPFLKGGFYLHAWKMEFLDTKIEAPLPKEFKKIVDSAFGK